MALNATNLADVLHRCSILGRSTFVIAACLSVLCLRLAGALPVEIPVTYDDRKGLFSARVQVGSPAQKLWATIDSASPWFWIPIAAGNKSHGFHPKDSHDKTEIAAKLDYAEGITVNGYRTSVKVKLGDGEVQNGPLLLVNNISDRNGLQRNLSNLQGVGMLGLTMRDEEAQLERYRTQRIFEIFSSSDRTEARTTLDSFFKAFWEEHPEVPTTFFLSFAGSQPRLVVGADLESGSDAIGLKPLADSFTRASELWYAPIRAIGFSLSGGGSGTLLWNLDFNQFQWGSYGAPARLDTATDSIVVSHVLFGHFINNFAEGQCTMNSMRGMDCPCNPSDIDSTFPWISISFETADTYRFLGFDTGADTRACIPPSAYVKTAARNGMCSLAIVDGGPYQRFFGREGIVLGVPFFRAVSVGFDVKRRRISVKNAPLSLSQASIPMDGQISVSSFQGQSPAAAPALGMAGEVCPCADPKNWWQVGHRFSFWRVVVVLVGTAILLSYVFVGYSPSAEGIRNQLEGLLGPQGSTSYSNASNAHSHQQETNEPFVQMTGQGGRWSGPE